MTNRISYPKIKYPMYLSSSAILQEVKGVFFVTCVQKRNYSNKLMIRMCLMMSLPLMWNRSGRVKAKKNNGQSHITLYEKSALEFR